MTIDPADRRPEARADNQDPALFGQTPSQTVGPFFTTDYLEGRRGPLGSPTWAHVPN